MKDKFFVFKWKNVLFFIPKSRLIAGINNSYYYFTDDTDMIIYFRSIINSVLILVYVYTPENFYALPEYDKVDMDVATRQYYDDIKKTNVKKMFNSEQYAFWDKRVKFEKTLGEISECCMPYFGIAIIDEKLVKL